MSPSRSAERAADGPTWRRPAAPSRRNCPAPCNRWNPGWSNVDEEPAGRLDAPAAAALLPLPLAAAPHTGWSEYDTSKVLKLSGKIVESGYEPPHGHIRLETPGKTWQVVLAPPSRMENRGLPRAWLKAGAAASVEGYANREKPEEMRAERIIINGKTVELR